MEVNEGASSGRSPPLITSQLSREPSSHGRKSLSPRLEQLAKPKTSAAISKRHTRKLSPDARAQGRKTTELQSPLYAPSSQPANAVISAAQARSLAAESKPGVLKSRTKSPSGDAKTPGSGRGDSLPRAKPNRQSAERVPSTASVSMNSLNEELHALLTSPNPAQLPSSGSAKPSGSNRKGYPSGKSITSHTRGPDLKRIQQALFAGAGVDAGEMAQGADSSNAEEPKSGELLLASSLVFLENDAGMPSPIRAEPFPATMRPKQFSQLLMYWNKWQSLTSGRRGWLDPQVKSSEFTEESHSSVSKSPASDFSIEGQDPGNWPRQPESQALEIERKLSIQGPVLPENDLSPEIDSNWTTPSKGKSDLSPEIDSNWTTPSQAINLRPFAPTPPVPVRVEAELETSNVGVSVSATLETASSAPTPPARKHKAKTVTKGQITPKKSKNGFKFKPASDSRFNESGASIVEGQLGFFVPSSEEHDSSLSHTVTVDCAPTEIDTPAEEGNEKQRRRLAKLLDSSNSESEEVTPEKRKANGVSSHSEKRTDKSRIRAALKTSLQAARNKLDHLQQDEQLETDANAKDAAVASHSAESRMEVLIGSQELSSEHDRQAYHQMANALSNSVRYPIINGGLESQQPPGFVLRSHLVTGTQYSELEAQTGQDMTARMQQEIVAENVNLRLKLRALNQTLDHERSRSQSIASAGNDQTGSACPTIAPLHPSSSLHDQDSPHAHDSNRNDVEQELSSAQRCLQDARAELELSMQMQEEAQSAAERLQADNQRLQAELAVKQHETTALTGQVWELEKQRDDCREQIDSFQKLLHQKMSEMHLMQDHVDHLENCLGLAASKQESLQKDMQERVRAFEGLVQVAEQQLTLCRKELSLVRDRNTILQGILQDDPSSSANGKDLESELKVLQQAVDQQRELIPVLLQKMSDSSDRIENSQVQVAHIFQDSRQPNYLMQSHSGSDTQVQKDSLEGHKREERILKLIDHLMRPSPTSNSPYHSILSGSKDSKGLDQSGMTTPQHSHSGAAHLIRVLENNLNEAEEEDEAEDAHHHPPHVIFSENLPSRILFSRLKHANNGETEILHTCLKESTFSFIQNCFSEFVDNRSPRLGMDWRIIGTFRIWQLGTLELWKDKTKVPGTSADAQQVSSQLAWQQYKMMESVRKTNSLKIRTEYQEIVLKVVEDALHEEFLDGGRSTLSQTPGAGGSIRFRHIDHTDPIFWGNHSPLPSAEFGNSAVSTPKSIAAAPLKSMITSEAEAKAAQTPTDSRIADAMAQLQSVEGKTQHVLQAIKELEKHSDRPSLKVQDSNHPDHAPPSSGANDTIELVEDQEEAGGLINNVSELLSQRNALLARVSDLSRKVEELHEQASKRSKKVIKQAKKIEDLVRLCEELKQPVHEASVDSEPIPSLLEGTFNDEAATNRSKMGDGEIGGTVCADELGHEADDGEETPFNPMIWKSFRSWKERYRMARSIRNQILGDLKLHWREMSDRSTAFVLWHKVVKTELKLRKHKMICAQRTFKLWAKRAATPLLMANLVAVLPMLQQSRILQVMLRVWWLLVVKPADLSNFLVPENAPPELREELRSMEKFKLLIKAFVADRPGIVADQCWTCKELAISRLSDFTIAQIGKQALFVWVHWRHKTRLQILLGRVQKGSDFDCKSTIFGSWRRHAVHQVRFRIRFVRHLRLKFRQTMRTAVSAWRSSIQRGMRLRFCDKMLCNTGGRPPVIGVVFRAWATFWSTKVASHENSAGGEMQHIASDDDEIVFNSQSVYTEFNVRLGVVSDRWLNHTAFTRWTLFWRRVSHEKVMIMRFQVQVIRKTFHQLRQLARKNLLEHYMHHLDCWATRRRTRLCLQQATRAWYVWTQGNTP